MGARNLSLVAGAITVSGGALHLKTLGIAQIALPEPGAIAQQIAGVTALLAVAIWRRRSSR